MTRPVTILMIPGSLRAGSSNLALLRTAQAVAPVGVNAALYAGLGGLPHFNPDDDNPEGDGLLHPAVADLRSHLRAADALLFSVPEYAGALPGSFKNLLDWAVGGGEVHGLPVGWINASGPAAPGGGVDAHESLRRVLGYLGARVVEAACLRIPVVRGSTDPRGLILNAGIRAQLAEVLGVLAGQVGERSG